MKLKNILGLALGALLITACSDNDELGRFDDISTDQTFLTIPESGGDVTVNIQAAEAWELMGLYEKITKHDDGTRDTTYTPLPNSPAWLSADKLSGPAGQSTLTLHADASEAGREAEVCILMGGRRQYLVVRQGSIEASDATCADVIAGPEGKTYRVKGAVTRIAGAQYGNFDITDETGTIYVYGIFDKEGKKGNYPLDGTDGWGIELGDIVTLEGPKQLYGSTVELVDATVVKVEKSLIKIISPDKNIGIEGGPVDVKIAYKGSGAYANIPADCDWVKYINTDYIPGTADIFNPNPADTAIVHFYVEPNTGGFRKAAIELTSSMSEMDDDGNVNVATSVMTYQIRQDAFVLPHGQEPNDPFTVSEAIAKCLEIGNTTDGEIYYAHGFISSIKEVSPGYGNATFNISDDGTDENALTVFRSKWLENTPFTAEDQIGVGDEVLIRGKLVYYKDNKTGNETPEFSGDVYVVSHKAAGPGSRLNPFTPEQANAFIMDNLAVGEVTADEYYIKGEISQIPNNGAFGAKYGNATFYLSEDGDPSNEQFYVFRTLYFGNRKWVEGDTQIQEGDQVVVCGRLTKYQDKDGNIIPETFNGKIDDVAVTPYLYSLNGKKE